MQWTCTGQQGVSGGDAGHFWEEALRASMLFPTCSFPFCQKRLHRPRPEREADKSQSHDHPVRDTWCEWEINLSCQEPLRFEGCSLPQHNLPYTD